MALRIRTKSNGPQGRSYRWTPSNQGERESFVKPNIEQLIIEVFIAEYGNERNCLLDFLPESDPSICSINLSQFQLPFFGRSSVRNACAELY